VPMNEETTHNKITNHSPQTSRLIEVLQSLEKQIKQQNSLEYAFVKGTIYGLSTVVGATVLVALFGGPFTSTTSLFTDSSPTPQA